MFIKTVFSVLNEHNIDVMDVVIRLEQYSGGYENEEMFHLFHVYLRGRLICKIADYDDESDIKFLIEQGLK